MDISKIINSLSPNDISSMNHYVDLFELSVGLFPRVLGTRASNTWYESMYPNQYRKSCDQMETRLCG